jgi:hypothetical protein
MANHAGVPATIALYAPAARQAPAAGLVQRALAHWPPCVGGGVVARPSVQLLALDDPADLARACPGDAAVIVPSSATPAAVLERLADALADALVPAVVLAEHPGHGLLRLRSSNLFIQPADAEPAAAAAMLATLLARQPAVRMLQNQLRVAQSLEGGITAEIERINDELLLAAHVQREFLPKTLPTIPGLDVGVVFRPAGFVSGDIYDVCRLDEHHLGFFLADAMGHGLPAALMTLFIAAHLNLKQVDGGSYRLVQPAEALGRLNAALYTARAGPSRFVSAVCGIIDARDATVTIASAGHPMPLRIGVGGVAPIEAQGTLLGILDDARYEQATIRLAPGEALVLHSDGVDAPNKAGAAQYVDGPDPDLRTPFEHRAAAHPHIRPTIAETLAAVENNLDRRIGSFHQGDDITLIAMATADPASAASRRAVQAGASA